MEKIVSLQAIGEYRANDEMLAAQIPIAIQMAAKSLGDKGMLEMFASLVPTQDTQKLAA